MGTMIRFPDDRMVERRSAAALSGPASVVILPVIRIERHTDETPGGFAPGEGSENGGRRRRRGRRS